MKVFSMPVNEENSDVDHRTKGRRGTKKKLQQCYIQFAGSNPGVVGSEEPIATNHMKKKRDKRREKNTKRTNANSNPSDQKTEEKN